jgi:hypothetical protein
VAIKKSALKPDKPLPRAALSDIMAKKQESFPVSTSVETVRVNEVSPPSARAGKVQLNVRLAREIRNRARMKAFEQGRELQDIVTELIEAWLRS